MRLKLRYKVVLLDVALTLIYILIMVLYGKLILNENGGIEGLINVYLLVLVFVSHYIWINMLWLGFIILGMLKKRRELILGGIYSMLLSVGLLLLESLSH